MNMITKGYKVNKTYQTQVYVTEIIDYEGPDGIEHSTCLTSTYGKMDSTYASNKHGTEREPDNDIEKDFICWYMGKFLGYHNDGEDERVNDKTEEDET